MSCRHSTRVWTLALLLAASGCASSPETAPNATGDGGLGAVLHDAAFPSHHREWRTDLALMPYCERDGDTYRIHNVRDFIYQSDDEYVVNYADRDLELSQLESVDFVVVPFKQVPSLAHTMLSFGFEDGNYLGVSVEARLEEGEKYSPVRGALRQYELMYVIAEERDLIARRTKHRDVDVYVYPTVATPEQAQALFAEVMDRVNQLAVQPEFYDTLTNNCTTNIVDHINRLRPGSITADLRLVLPGFSDRLAYDLGLLKSDRPFLETKRQARVNDLANRFAESDDFSQKIRRR